MIEFVIVSVDSGDYGEGGFDEIHSIYLSKDAADKFIAEQAELFAHMRTASEYPEFDCRSLTHHYAMTRKEIAKFEDDARKAHDEEKMRTCTQRAKELQIPEEQLAKMIEYLFDIDCRWINHPDTVVIVEAEIK